LPLTAFVEDSSVDWEIMGDGVKAKDYVLRRKVDAG
jgi:hypothetical protein